MTRANLPAGTPAALAAPALRAGYLFRLTFPSLTAWRFLPVALVIESAHTRLPQLAVGALTAQSIFVQNEGCKFLGGNTDCPRD